jgi:hypothetical protein
VASLPNPECWDVGSGTDSCSCISDSREVGFIANCDSDFLFCHATVAIAVVVRRAGAKIYSTQTFKIQLQLLDPRRTDHRIDHCTRAASKISNSPLQDGHNRQGESSYSPRAGNRRAHRAVAAPSTTSISIHRKQLIPEHIVVRWQYDPEPHR